MEEGEGGRVHCVRGEDGVGDERHIPTPMVNPLSR